MACTNPPDNDPLVDNPTYLGNIRYFFNEADIACMGPRGIDLSTYAGVKSHATNIYLQTQSGNMPDGGQCWSSNRVQTFLNWMTNGYPMGTAQAASAARLGAAVPNAGARLRKNINSLTQPELDALIAAFRGIMALDPSDPNSYYNVASQHGVPHLYCMHHVQPFTAWHRVYMKRFEDALRSVPGCEDVTLPYWDVTTQAPDLFWQDPFASYTVPVDLGPPYGANYTTQRNSAADIYQAYTTVAPTVVSSIQTCLTKSQFGTWTTDGFDYYLVQGHDNAHDEGGPTLQLPDVASYDPIFWFFHCNWDRLWLSWQYIAGATTLAGFKSTLGGNTGWLGLPLQPYPTTSADQVFDPEVTYDKLDTPPTDVLNARAPHIEAARAFTIPESAPVSVRVKDINRLNIPGTFVVRLLADGEQVARQAFFQPVAPRECPTCVQQGLVSIDFHVDQEQIQGRKLSIAIDARALGQGDEGRFPLSQAGNPTINARLMIEEAE